MSSSLDDRFEAAHALRMSGAYAAALETYDAIITELDDEPDLESREDAARALILKAQTLGDLGRGGEEVATYDLVVERYGEADERELADQVMRALARKASAIGERGRLDEALVLYDAIVVRDEAVGDARIAEIAARARISRATCLGELGRLAEAVEASREAVEYLDDSSSPRLAELRVRAQVNEGIFLGWSGENEHALAIFEAVLELTVDLDDASLVEDVLRASVFRANTLRGLGRADEALECLRQAIERFSDARGLRAHHYLASTRRVYARMLGELGHWPDAVAVCDALIAALALDPEDTLECREEIAEALIAKGTLLRDNGERAGAVAAFRTAFDRYSADPRGRLSGLACWAGFEAARLADSFRRPGEALELNRAIVERFRECDDEYVANLVARAELNVKGLTYRVRILRGLGLRRQR